MCAGGSDGAAGGEHDEESAAAAGLDLVDAVIEETHADMAAHANGVYDSVSSTRVQAHAAQCARMLADTQNVETARVVNPAVEAAPARTSSKAHYGTCRSARKASTRQVSKRVILRL